MVNFVMVGKTVERNWGRRQNSRIVEGREGSKKYETED
jgi:hypothetical protein